MNHEIAMELIKNLLFVIGAVIAASAILCIPGVMDDGSFDDDKHR